MGNGMNKVLPGLFLGSFRDGKDLDQLKANRITHIVSIHDNARKVVEDKHYLCIRVPDAPNENVSKYFSECNDFIHGARTKGGNVLVHCLAGVSRSATIAAAYVMSITTLSSKEALKVVRGARTIASPNHGFLTQLKEFEFHALLQERKRIKDKYPDSTDSKEIKDECDKMVKVYYATVEKPSALPQAAAGISPLSSPRHRSYPSSPRRKSFLFSTSSHSTPSSSQNSSPYSSPKKQRYGRKNPPGSPRKA